MTYQTKDFSHLKGMEGFSDTLLEDHFSLYEGYVKNTNSLLEIFAAAAQKGELDTPEHAELRRRLGWEWNGMRLHEFYFGNLGGHGKLDGANDVESKIVKEFGDVERWTDEFRAIGGMRGIGWVILYHDPVANRLVNFWIDEHDSAHAAGGSPLLVMDVWEHAFFTDYRTNKADYIEAFLANVDWGVVEKRFDASREPSVVQAT